jgi:hypothetical protein
VENGVSTIQNPSTYGLLIWCTKAARFIWAIAVYLSSTHLSLISLYIPPFLLSQFIYLIFIGDAVVNEDYRLKRVENVYVTGGSLWPKGGSWNPTLMMVGMAQHLADSFYGMFSPLLPLSGKRKEEITNEHIANLCFFSSFSKFRKVRFCSFY